LVAEVIAEVASIVSSAMIAGARPPSGESGGEVLHATRQVELRHREEEPEGVGPKSVVFAVASDKMDDRTGDLLYQVRKIRALLFHGLCRLGKIDWASESHQELDRCLSRAITASKNFND
jgi:hypothetical protein